LILSKEGEVLRLQQGRSILQQYQTQGTFEVPSSCNALCGEVQTARQTVYFAAKYLQTDLPLNKFIASEAAKEVERDTPHPLSTRPRHTLHATERGRSAAVVEVSCEYLKQIDQWRTKDYLPSISYCRPPEVCCERTAWSARRKRSDCAVSAAWRRQSSASCSARPRSDRSRLECLVR